MSKQSANSADLRCAHCGIERTYADANIVRVQNKTCPENTEKETVYDGIKMRTVTRELRHEWYEP